jgi:inner membrane protein
MVFSPFSDWKLAIPLVFILDPYFTTIILAGLLGGALCQNRRYPAIVALTALAGYLVLQIILREHALQIGYAYARAYGLADAVVKALPQPLSPLNWKIIVSTAAAHHEAFVNLAGNGELQPSGHEWLLVRIYSGYQPPSSATWRRWTRVDASAVEPTLAREAWNADALADFRRFAVIPALYRLDSTWASECAWFVDLRFTLPGVAPSFVYGACRDGLTPWKLNRMKGQFLID